MQQIRKPRMRFHIEIGRDRRDNSPGTAQARVASVRNKFNNVSNRVLAAFFGEETQGTIDRYVKGLYHILADRQAQQNIWLATAERVLSLDLPCVSAVICRPSKNPILLIHDNPCEGVVKLPIYRRLYKVVLELDRSFGNPEQSSLYLVNTTTHPPRFLAIVLNTTATLSREKPSGF